MAILLSVTVSIAEDKNGTLSFILFVSFKLISVFEGRIDEKRGSIKTSSKVKASFIVSI